MRSHVVAVLCLGLALQACERKRSIYSDAPGVRAAAPQAAPGAAPRYVGRWAVSAAACEQHPWVFTKDSLVTPAGISCALVPGDPTPAGYSATSLCDAKPGRVVLTLTRSAAGDSLSITDASFSGPVSLTRCPAQG